jgi:hypothetical protein
MMYANRSDWTVHASELGVATAFLVHENGDGLTVGAVLPGTFGNKVRKGAFAEFDECVAANQLLDPMVVDFEGGRLGVVLVESDYDDNVAGPLGASPRWALERLDACSE